VSSWQITNLVALAVLPPGCLILAAIAACCWAPRSRRGPPIALAALLTLYALSTPYLADALLRTIEPAAANPMADTSPGAIVVLGGGTYFNAPEYAGDTVSERTLVRVRYGAALYRATGKPLLVTGGSPEGRGTGEARQMQAVLTQEFNVPVRWMEEKSRNTLENGRLSRQLLESAGIRSIYLVTDAWHMPRAQLSFERAGLHVVPAPTGFATSRPLSVLDFLPQSRALLDSQRYFHEVAGNAWYRLKLATGQ
jgi:uncharacterized SAM-binding protein YcdF (DUF218 family)